MPSGINRFDELLLISQAGLSDRLLTAWDQLVRIVTALFVIAIIFLLARIVAKFLLRRIWKRLPIDEVTPATESLVNNSVALFFYALAFTVTLAFLGASWATLVTAFSVSTIAAIFGFQDLLKSILGGAFLIVERPYQVGERIKVRDNEGEVAEIGVRTTTMLTDDHATVIIPNSLHLSEPFRNLDRETSVSSIIRVVGIDRDRATASQLIEQALGIEPAIGSQIAFTNDAEHAWVERVLDVVIHRRLHTKRKNSSSDPAKIRARVILHSNRNSSREIEKEAMHRLREAFPGAVVTVRRSSMFTEEDRDVD